jgi:hypothetical protein
MAIIPRSSNPSGAIHARAATSRSLSAGVIAGIAVAVVVFAASLGGLILFVLWSRKRSCKAKCGAVPPLFRIEAAGPHHELSPIQRPPTPTSTCTQACPTTSKRSSKISLNSVLNGKAVVENDQRILGHDYPSSRLSAKHGRYIWKLGNNRSQLIRQ